MSDCPNSHTSFNSSAAAVLLKGCAMPSMNRKHFWLQKWFSGTHTWPCSCGKTSAIDPFAKLQPSQSLSQQAMLHIGSLFWFNLYFFHMRLQLPPCIGKEICLFRETARILLPPHPFCQMTSCMYQSEFDLNFDIWLFGAPCWCFLQAWWEFF